MTPKDEVLKTVLYRVEAEVFDSEGTDDFYRGYISALSNVCRYIVDMLDDKTIGAK